MIKILLIIIAIFTISCTQNIRYLRGSYSQSHRWSNSRYEFLDSLNFLETFFSCVENELWYGKYEIDDDKLILKYDIYPDDKIFIFNQVDSLLCTIEKKELKINFIESYSNKPIENGVVELYDSKTNKLLKVDTCDLNGNITIKFTPITQYILKTKFIKEKNFEKYFNEYYKTEICLKPNYNYNVIIKTVKPTEEVWGETLIYKIL